MPGRQFLRRAGPPENPADLMAACQRVVGSASQESDAHRQITGPEGLRKHSGFTSIGPSPSEAYPDARGVNGSAK